jgi:hypothetical protein
MRTSVTIIAGLLVLTAVSGCTSNVRPIDEPPPRVTSQTLNFRMADASVARPFASVQYNVPAITQGVVDHGAVLAYFREEGTWTALPYMFAYESADFDAVDFTIVFGYAFEYRFLELFYEASTMEVNPANQPDRVIKLVIIDGFPVGKNLDLTDYEAVRAYFGLED